MANWFGSSTGLFKGRAPETPQPFEIDCECGQRHTGLRRQHHQRIICKACGTAIFILPKDVYPATSEMPPATTAKPWQDEVHQDDNVFADVASDVEETAAPKNRKPRSHANSASNQKKAASAAKAPPSPIKPPRPKRHPSQGPLITPLRVVSVMMLIVIAVTVFFVVRMQRLEDAKRRLAESIEQFNQALEVRDWPLARSSINEAVECLDILGRHDTVALKHRQFYREIRAMNDLARSSLFDIVEESDANRVSNPDDWEATFGSHHKGRWLVMELPVRRGAEIDVDEAEQDADEVARPRYEYSFEFPVLVGSKNRFVEIELDLPVLDKLSFDDSRSVVVAAQLRGIELSNDSNHWIVSFEPSTAFLWVNIETYEGLGFTFSDWYPREQVQALLTEQAVAVGLELASEPAGGENPGNELALNKEESE